MVKSSSQIKDFEVFKASTDTDAWAPTFHSFEKSQELVKATWECDEEKVAELLEWFHDQASNKTYNDEAAGDGSF